MFIPIRTDVPLRRTPYMNWAIIALCVIGYMVQISAFRKDMGRPFMLNARDPHIWQFFTYQFMHGSTMHLLSNMLFLFIFGNNVNDKLGNIAYLGFYLAGGVFAGIASVLTDTGYVVGASGSIASVTGAYLVLLPRSHITIFYFFYLIGSFELSGMWFVLAFFALDVFYQFGGAGGDQGIAHMAHIGGTLFGIAVCLLLLWTKLLPRDMFDVLALIDRWNRRRQHRDAVSRGYDPFGYVPRGAARRELPNPMIDRIQDLRASISAAIAHQNLPEAVKLYLELRAIDPNQVLSRQAQLDVANQLFSQQIYPAAADSYELYLRAYPKADQIENVQLMVGIIFARYLQRYDKAKEYLEAALPRLHAPRDVELAKSELEQIQKSQSPQV